MGKFGRVAGRALLLAAAVVWPLCLSGCSKKPAQEHIPERRGTLSAASDAPSETRDASPAAAPGDTFTDARDGKKYRTVKIGFQTWMAQNLNFHTPSGSWCYNDSLSYCDKYGALYGWRAAAAACPAGWHLPTSREWYVLITAAGGGMAGTKLKSKTGWDKIPKDYDGYERYGDRWCSAAQYMADRWNCANCKQNRYGKRWCYWPELIHGTDDFGFSALPGGRRRHYAGYESTWWTASQHYDYARYMRAYYDMDDMESYISDTTAEFSVRCVMNEGDSGAAPIYTVTVYGAAASASGDGCYFAGATVNISAGTAPKGLRFEKWTTENSGVNIADERSAATTFTMPANNVTVTAVFQNIKVRGNAIISGDTLIDVDDGQRYKTAVIGGKRWMAQNLNYLPESGDSWCYYNYTPYCDKYGRLYDWNTARAVCPGGYHLPSHEEWSTLAWGKSGERMLGYWDKHVSKKLQAKHGWQKSHLGNGTDNYGFMALPGGIRDYKSGEFYSGGETGEWWTATTDTTFNTTFNTAFNKDYAYNIGMGYDKYVGPPSADKGFGFSVRCVEDGK